MENKWLAVLNDDDLEFIHQFILASGSLKGLAAHYGVTYPTIRNRADRIINKVRLTDDEDSPYVLHIKTMAMDGKITQEAAKELITTFRIMFKEK